MSPAAHCQKVHIWGFGWIKRRPEVEVASFPPEADRRQRLAGDSGRNRLGSQWHNSGH